MMNDKWQDLDEGGGDPTRPIPGQSSIPGKPCADMLSPDDAGGEIESQLRASLARWTSEWADEPFDASVVAGHLHVIVTRRAARRRRTRQVAIAAAMAGLVIGVLPLLRSQRSEQRATQRVEQAAEPAVGQRAADLAGPRSRASMSPGSSLTGAEVHMAGPNSEEPDWFSASRSANPESRIPLPAPRSPLPEPRTPNSEVLAEAFREGQVVAIQWCSTDGSQRWLVPVAWEQRNAQGELEQQTGWMETAAPAPQLMEQPAYWSPAVRTAVDEALRLPGEPDEGRVGV